VRVCAELTVVGVRRIAGNQARIVPDYTVAADLQPKSDIFGQLTIERRVLMGGGELRVGFTPRVLCEGFGPLTFAMALVSEEGRLSLVMRRWSAFGVPLPMWLCPRSNAYETVEDGRFRFHVEIGHLLTGLIVRYRGWLVPDDRA